jgi:hypothetical protein
VAHLSLQSKLSCCQSFISSILLFKNGLFSIFTGNDYIPNSAQSLPVINLFIIDPDMEILFFVCFLHLLYLVPVQQPEALSSIIRTLDQMNCDTQVVSFLSSFSCNWNKAIKNSLMNSTFGAFGPAMKGLMLHPFSMKLSIWRDLLLS